MPPVDHRSCRLPAHHPLVTVPGYNSKDGVTSIPLHYAVAMITSYLGGGWSPDEDGALIFYMRSGEPAFRCRVGYSLQKMASICRLLERNGGTCWQS